MKFIEVDCLFRLPVTGARKSHLTSMYGDDTSDWPESEIEYKKYPLSLNVERISTFNKSPNETRTSVRMMSDGDPYLIDMEYSAFKQLVQHALR